MGREARCARDGHGGALRAKTRRERARAPATVVHEARGQVHHDVASRARGLHVCEPRARATRGAVAAKTSSPGEKRGDAANTPQPFAAGEERSS